MRLQLSDIRHAFDGDPVLRGVSLSVGAGEIVCLLGPSGCGKTTLLRIAAGIERQNAGEVAVDGSLVAGPGRFVPAERRGLGFVFQDFALFPHLTVLGNVLYGVRGLARREAEALARRALARVGLAQYETSYPHLLSGGEQQRVALVRALLPAPRVLMLDEPFSGLDRSLRARVRAETASLLRERGDTAVMVTHDPEEALAIADRIALMRDGRILQIASPETLYRRPVDLAAARMFSDLSVMRGRVAGGFAATPLGLVPAPAAREGAEVTIAVRPSAVGLAGTAAGPEAGIIGRSFLGDRVRLEALVEGLPESVFLETAPDTEVAVGSRVRIQLDPAAALVFGDP